MPVVPGKPGTKRIRGVLRAQCKQVKTRCARLLTVQAQYAAKVPPVTFMSELSEASVLACRDAMTVLLNAVN